MGEDALGPLELSEGGAHRGIPGPVGPGAHGLGLGAGKGPEGLRRSFEIPHRVAPAADEVGNSHHAGAKGAELVSEGKEGSLAIIERSFRGFRVAGEGVEGSPRELGGAVPEVIPDRSKQLRAQRLGGAHGVAPVARKRSRLALKAPTSVTAVPPGRASSPKRPGLTARIRCEAKRSRITP